MATATATAPATLTGNKASLLSSTLVIARRTFLKFIRTPQLVVVGTIQGAMFLLIFRYVFGGAIQAGGVKYVNFLAPGFITTGIIWQGMMSAGGIAEDLDQGFFDRLRSLPIPRAAVLTGRALADTGSQVWGLTIMTIIGFLIGFRLGGSVANGILAFVLIVVFAFAFEWVFITLGMYAGNAQAAQGMSLMLVPFTFVSSAFVPVASMPSGLRAVARNQPVTFMVDAVRRLVLGPNSSATLGLVHTSGYYVARALIWSAIIVAVFGSIAVNRYRKG
ncbi:MAG TPA: ABC transporter permease [Actinomycetota bacterium]|nr:ABC transporter permease [Actinomycetota bacterium]